MIGRMLSWIMRMIIMICMVWIIRCDNDSMGCDDTNNDNTGDIMSDMNVVIDCDMVNIDMIVDSVSATWYRTNVRPSHFCQYTPTYDIITSQILNISIRISLNTTIIHTINIIIR